jgi:hypothetical protein
MTCSKNSITKKQGSKLGRPRVISKEICEELCPRLIHVGSLRQVCKADDMPCRRSVFNWLSKAEGNDAPQIYRDFLHQYEAAREWAIDSSFDELEHQLREIALVPVMVNDKETGEQIPLVVNGEVIKSQRHYQSLWPSFTGKPTNGKWLEKTQRNTAIRFGKNTL